MTAIVTLTMNPALDITTATERVVPAHKLRCSVPRYDPGGGGINVARAVHALGGRTIAVFPAGGSAGDTIRLMLRKQGVPHRAVAIAGFSRESLAVEEQASGEQYRFILPGPELSASEQERCLDAFFAAAREAQYVVASGSLPLGVAEDFYARLGDLARREGKRFVLDTSGPALKAAACGLYLLKPSLRELADLIERPIETEADEEDAARSLVEEGRAEIVVVSLGSRGALLATAAGVERFAAIPVAAQSTVGAGDSMLAGTILGLVRKMPLHEAVLFGMAAGTAALYGSGTQLCRREDVEQLYAQLSERRPNRR